MMNKTFELMFRSEKDFFPHKFDDIGQQYQILLFDNSYNYSTFFIKKAYYKFGRFWIRTNSIDEYYYNRCIYIYSIDNKSIVIIKPRKDYKADLFVTKFYYNFIIKVIESPVLDYVGTDTFQGHYLHYNSVKEIDYHKLSSILEHYSSIKILDSLKH